MISVVLVDDHAMVVKALSRLLDRQPDITVVGTATDGTAAQDVILRARPDIAILDISMPPPDGFHVTVELRRQRLRTRVLFLSAYANPEYVQRALDLRVHGYVTKQEPHEVLIEAVRTIASDRMAIGPEVMPLVQVLCHPLQIHGREQVASPLRASALTDLERRAIQLRAAGRSCTQTAAAMRIKRSSSRTLYQRGLYKLGLRTLPGPSFVKP